MTESVTSKINTAGSTYVLKLLNSRPENWERIAGVVDHRDLTGALVKLTARDFTRIARATTSKPQTLFSELSRGSRTCCSSTKRS